MARHAAVSRECPCANLCGENVAGGPADGGAERDERLDEDRSLSVDVSAADDFGSFQRLVLFGALAEGHDAGHFCISFISFILW